MVGRALLITMREEALDRPETDPRLHIADRCDTQLARLMRRVADAQRQLDAYVIAQTDVGGERSK